MTIRTAVVPVSEIFGLRWEVLRPGLPRESAKFPGDALSGAFHIAAYDADADDGAVQDAGAGGPDAAGTEAAGPGAGTVLGCGSFFPEPCPGMAGSAYRIRGMASDARVRGQGYGAAVLLAGTQEARARGARLMWCNGRTGARGFYERYGYTVAGDEFVIEGVGPHFVFVRELG